MKAYLLDHNQTSLCSASTSGVSVGYAYNAINQFIGQRGQPREVGSAGISSGGLLPGVEGSGHWGNTRWMDPFPQAKVRSFHSRKRQTNYG